MSLVQIVICPSRLDSGHLILKREEEEEEEEEEEGELAHTHNPKTEIKKEGLFE